MPFYLQYFNFQLPKRGQAVWDKIPTFAVYFLMVPIKLKISCNTQDNCFVAHVVNLLLTPFQGTQVQDKDQTTPVITNILQIQVTDYLTLYIYRHFFHVVQLMIFVQTCLNC